MIYLKNVIEKILYKIILIINKKSCNIVYKQCLFVLNTNKHNMNIT